MGLPTPSLEWMHNGQLLSNSDDLITISITQGLSSNTSTLQWMNVPYDADGMHSCVARNNLGSDMLSFRVIILSKFVCSITDPVWVCVSE